MKADKYYTPVIEEFHVGFKYQTYSPDKGFTTRIFKVEIPDLLPHIEWRLRKHPSYTRVKYLDERDIKSFGIDVRSYNEGQLERRLVYGDDFIAGAMTNKHCDYYFSYWKESKKMVVEVHNNSYMPYGELKTLFCGEIKNKSELKRLLTQLKIV